MWARVLLLACVVLPVSCSSPCTTAAPPTCTSFTCPAGWVNRLQAYNLQGTPSAKLCCLHPTVVGEPTTAKPNMDAIIGGSVAGGVAVAAGIGAIIAWDQNRHDDDSSAPVTTDAPTPFTTDAPTPFTTDAPTPFPTDEPTVLPRLVNYTNETAAASSSSASASNPWLWVSLALLVAGCAICMAALLFCFCQPSKKPKKSARKVVGPEPLVAAAAEPEMVLPELTPLMSFAPAYQVAAPVYQVAAPVYQVAAPAYQVAAPASSGYVFR